MDTNRISLSEIAQATPVEEPIYIALGNATIEVRRRISYEEILNMMQWCIDMIVGEKPFLSAPLTRIVKDFAILNAFTNLDCGVSKTYEEISDLYADYDFIKAYGILDEILPKLNQEQIKFFERTLDKTMESIIAYRNSAKGIVDALAAEAEEDSNKIERALSLFSSEEQQEQVKRLIETAQKIQG